MAVDDPKEVWPQPIELSRSRGVEPIPHDRDSAAGHSTTSTIPVGASRLSTVRRAASATPMRGGDGTLVS